MRIKAKSYSIALASIFLIISLIFISSTALASTVQNSSPNGQFAYITHQGGSTVSKINTTTNTVTATVNVGRNPGAVAASSDGSKVYVACNDYPTCAVYVIDTATKTVSATVPIGYNPFGIAVSPDGTKVYAANYNNLTVIDTTTNTVTATVHVVGTAPYGVEVSPDGSKVYVANTGKGVSVIDAGTNTVTATVPVGRYPHGVAISPDGTKVYVTSQLSDSVSVIDTATNNVTAIVPVGIYPSGVAVTPDGKKIYVANYGNYSVPGNTVSVIDAATNTVITTVSVGVSPLGISITSDGKKVYVVNQGSGSASIIDTAIDKVTSTVNVGNSPSSFGNFIGGRPVVPVANFSINATRGNAPLSVHFTDLSKYATKWNWDFGDGNTSTDQNPTHTYSKVGNYTVNMTVTNGDGTNSKLAVIKVLTQPILPIADFTVNVTRGYAPLGVQFTDYSDNAIEWNWDFGDGNTSTDLNPVHTYSKAGTYTVNLTSINRNGPNSKLTTVTVVPPLKITETRITTNESDQYRPVIYGDRIVWLDLRNGNTSSIKFDIYMYNLSTHQETQINTNESGGTPVIYDDRIIWGGISTHNGTRKMDLYMYNLSTQQKTQITTNESVDPCDAAIYGDRIVWDDYRNANFNADIYYPDIYMYNLSTSKEVQVTTNRSVGRYLDIYGDRIVWQDERNGTHIYMYNISTSTETQITNHESPQMLPSIYGDRIVWADLRNGGSDIYMYNLSTSQETQITTSGAAWNPKINGNRIVWIDSRNGRDDIYMYDLSTSMETQLTNEASHGYSAIYGDRLVWMDYRNGNWDIYMCTVSVEDSGSVSDWHFLPQEPVSGDILNINGMTSPGGKVNKSVTFEKIIPVSEGRFEYILENVTIPEGLDNLFTVEARGVNNLNVRVKTVIWVTKSSDASGDTAIVSQSNVPAGAYTIKIDGDAGEGISEVDLKITASQVIQADSNGNFSYFFNTAAVPPGNFEVKVGDIIKEITLRPKEAEQPSSVLPVANFSTNVREFFAPLTVQFTDLSQNATSMNWNFGDGSTSTEQNPIHTYYAAGSYKANLTVFNENGTDSKSTTITVFEKPIIVLPVASFSTNTTEGYAPLAVQFNDSSENADTVSWDFNGDGINDSIERNPIHEFITLGNYTVNLTATNKNGTNSKSARITVRELSKVLPVANFSSNVTQGSAPLFVQFTDLSENAIGCDWNFGDGSNSTNQNPIHTYSVAGNYIVNLTSTNVNGTNSKFAQITVLEKTTVVLPVADFTSNITQGYAPLFIQFTDLSKNVTGYNWNFGDGNNSIEQNPMHRYIAPGYYTVSLTVVNENGTDSKSTTINVFEKPVLPVANFSTNVSEGFASLSVQFNDSSENATSVNWDFGDGNNSTERNPIHEFTLLGNYTVNLTVANENGTDSKFATINVIGKSAVLPVANFNSNVTTGNSPLSVQFTDLSNNATEWNWSFGDGANSVAQNPTHTYYTAGNYTVILTANNSVGSNTVTKYSYITVVKPDETIIEGHAPLSVQFKDLSEGATAWNWNFGDGNTSTEQNPTNTYNETGQYTVTLTANNIAGSNVITKNSYIIVTNSTEAPVADFSVSTTSGKTPLNISFMDKSTGSPKSLNWDFGDGNTSTEQNPMHTYSAAGNYTVTLTANNSAGSSAITKYSYIFVANSLKAPVADFSASTTLGEAPLNVSY